MARSAMQDIDDRLAAVSDSHGRRILEVYFTNIVRCF